MRLISLAIRLSYLWKWTVINFWEQANIFPTGQTLTFTQTLLWNVKIDNPYLLQEGSTSLPFPYDVWVTWSHLDSQPYIFRKLKGFLLPQVRAEIVSSVSVSFVQCPFSHALLKFSEAIRTNISNHRYIKERLKQCTHHVGQVCTGLLS